MYTVILCGGFGSRLREETEFKPKPMINIGTKPILWHIMKSYSQFGFYNFILTLGYKSEIIKNYFLNYDNLNNDIEIKLGEKNQQVKFLNDNSSDDSNWRLILSETGLESSTGYRLWLIRDYLFKNEHSDFMLTYGDGLADININQLIKFHKKSGKLGTITAVHNQSRFGNLVIQDGICKDFSEKARSKDSWINAGFCIFNKKVLEFLTDKKEESFEEGLLTRLTKKNELAVYKHSGFWQCMDTNREAVILNEIWKRGEAPWKIWN
jgi:glucose-1-phosphate cytidylyltransferase